MATYKPSPLFKVFGGATTHFPRMYRNVEVGLTLDVLDLVDPWLQFSVLEDGRGVAGRVQSHGRHSKCGNCRERRDRGTIGAGVVRLPDFRYSRQSG